MRALYRTLVDLDYIALQLFMMGAKLNEKKNTVRYEGGSELVEVYRREEILVDLLVFLGLSEKETAS